MALQYYFDSSDKIVGFTYNGVAYVYLKNLQNDIIAIADVNGNILVKYYYDAFGNILLVNDTSGIGLGTKNPFRFKSYYYDEETQFYYLNSQYYDPFTGRFISADDPKVLGITGGKIDGENLFAYCSNNPVMNSDPSGFSPIRCINLQGTYKGKTACINAILSLILTTAVVTYAFFSPGESLISLGMAGQIFSFHLSSAVTIPMIIGGFLMCTGSVIYAVYMAAMIVKAISYYSEYNMFKIKKTRGFSLFTYSVTKA